jgi:hypothetical protein
MAALGASWEVWPANGWEKRLERLEERMATQFTWLVGLQITTLVAVVGVLLART